MTRTASLFTLVFLLFTGAAFADDARSLLTQAIVAFGQNDLDTATELLARAESSTSEPDDLALILRQRGIVQEVRGERKDAVLSFMRALYFSETITLSEKEHGGQVGRLFDCAKALHREGIKTNAVTARWPKAFDEADWVCPVTLAPFADPPRDVSLNVPPPGAPDPALTATAEPEERSVLSSPWLWVAVGVVAAGAATIAIVSLNADEDPYGGTTGVTLQLPNE